MVDTRVNKFDRNGRFERELLLSKCGKFQIASYNYHEEIRLRIKAGDFRVRIIIKTASTEGFDKTISPTHNFGLGKNDQTGEHKI